MRRLHEFDRRPVRIAHVGHPFSGIRTGGECLRLARRFPTRVSNYRDDGIKIIDRQRDMHRPDVAWTRFETLSVRRCKIFEQLDLVAVTCEHRDQNFRAGNAGHFTRERAAVMCPMRKREPENAPPESQRTLEICDRDAGVIDGPDAK